MIRSQKEKIDALVTDKKTLISECNGLQLKLEMMMEHRADAIQNYFGELIKKGSLELEEGLLMRKFWKRNQFAA